MTRSALFTAAVAVAGCSQQPPETPAAPQVTLTAAAAEPRPALPVPPTPQAKQPAKESVAAEPPQPRPPAPPPVFEYPADLGGKAAAKAVAPRLAPLALVVESRGGPKPRATAKAVTEPEAVPAAMCDLPPLLPGRAKDLRPGAPPERVPVDLGLLAAAVPARPAFPVAAGVTERAPDVKEPPRLPTLGRQLADRVSLDDPTAELGHAAITAPAVAVSVPPAGFLKVSLPDPFELGAQVKPSVPPAAQPGLSPVPVNPQRVK